jgi:K+-sensing histidine kinase KdpD
MQNVRRYKGPLTLAGAACIPLGIAGLLVPFRSSFAAPAAALLFVAVIVAIAVVGNRLAGVLATISSTLWFDLFLTRPYERLAITHRADIETAVSLFIVGVVVTELAARNRNHHSMATREAGHVDLMYEFSELAASGAPAEDVIERTKGALTDLLGLRSCRYEQGPRVRTRLTIEHDGLVLLGGNVWDVDEMGLPGPEIELEVHGRGVVLGRFVLSPTPGLPVPFQQRVVAIALIDQVGAALVPELRSA